MSTQVDVDKILVNKTARMIIDSILKQREHLRNAVLEEALKPYRYFIFWKKKRTLEEAKYFLKKEEQFWNSSRPLFHLWYADNQLKTAENLLKASIINKGETILLSLKDAVMIENWRKL